MVQRNNVVHHLTTFISPYSRPENKHINCWITLYCKTHKQKEEKWNNKENLLMKYIPMKLIQIHWRESKSTEGIFKGSENTFTTQPPWQCSKLGSNSNLCFWIPFFSFFNKSLYNKQMEASICNFPYELKMGKMTPKFSANTFQEEPPNLWLPVQTVGGDIFYFSYWHLCLSNGEGEKII